MREQILKELNEARGVIDKLIADDKVIESIKNVSYQHP